MVGNLETNAHITPLLKHRVVIRQWFSKYGAYFSSFSNAWELVRNADLKSPTSDLPQQQSRGVAQPFVLTSSPDDSRAP